MDQISFEWFAKIFLIKSMKEREEKETLKAKMVWKNLAQLDNEASINYCNDSANSWLMISLIGVKRFLRLSKKRSVKIPHVKNWPNRLCKKVQYFTSILFICLNSVFYCNCQNWGKNYFSAFLHPRGENETQLKAKLF